MKPMEAKKAFLASVNETLEVQSREVGLLIERAGTTPRCNGLTKKLARLQESIAMVRGKKNQEVF